MNTRNLNKQMTLLIESATKPSHAATLSPEDLMNYISEKHKKGWEKKEYDDWDAVNKYSVWKLENVNVADLKIKAAKPKVAKHYSNNGNNEFPPIVVDPQTGIILDGNHRAMATEIRGGKTIKAYVGYNEN